MTLGKKIAALAALTVLVATAAGAYLAGKRQADALERALEARANTIATTLGMVVANDIITGNIANVSATVDAIAARDPEILTITIWDEEGNLLTTRTREGARAAGAAHAVRLPIHVPKTDLALGTVECLFTKEPLRDSVRSMWREAVLVATALAVVAIVLALVVAARIARPVRRLEAAARRVAGGDLSVRVAVESSDEVGRLAGEFNQMVGELASARAALERRIQELAALYDASRVIQSATDLDEVQGLVLEALTTGLGIPAAAVALADEEGKRLEIAAARGLDGAKGSRIETSIAGADVGPADEARLPEPLRGKGPVRVAPMRVAGRLVGALLAVGERADGGGEIDRLLAVLAAQMGPAVDAAEKAARARAAIADPFTPLARRVGAEIEKALRHGLPVSVARFRLVDAAAKARRDGWAAVDAFFERFLKDLAANVPEAALVARFGPDAGIAVLPAVSKAEGRALLMRLDLPGMDEVEGTVVTHPEDGASAIEMLAKV